MAANGLVIAVIEDGRPVDDKKDKMLLLNEPCKRYDNVGVSKIKLHYAKRSPNSPVSPIVGYGDLIFVSGQVSVNTETGEVRGCDIQSQSYGALTNLKMFLEDAGSSIDKILSISVYLKNAEDFPQMNEVFSEWFSANPPARTTVRADMIFPEFLIEISAIAYR